jgi:hypothetical protein
MRIWEKEKAGERCKETIEDKESAELSKSKEESWAEPRGQEKEVRSEV